MSPAKKKGASTKGALRIRMYDVGFGDCFLIFFPDGKTMLVDSGFHAQGKGAFSGKELAERVISDVEAATGSKRIDVVVATHRHQDHVFSFNAEEWDAIEVGEVWLPWVEDTTNAEARKLWKKQRQFALQLASALPSFGLSVEDRATADFLLWNAGIGDGGGGPWAAWSNDGALNRLRSGFLRRDVAEPRYLPATEDYPETFTTNLLPDVRVTVLGPPRDPKLFAELDPESDGETYRALLLRAAVAGMPVGGNDTSPFGPAWFATPGPGVPSPLSGDELERLSDLSRNVDPLFAARKLDGMINSTSLVLVLDIGKARLLLPGDAEWGTWKRILDNEKAKALLRGTTFLKVSHHGSHNATPKSLLETKILPGGIPAMISTQEGPGSYRNDIPLPELLTAFEQHNVLAVRSDKLPANLPDGFVRGNEGTWVDVTLKC